MSTVDVGDTVIVNNNHFTNKPMVVSKFYADSNNMWAKYLNDNGEIIETPIFEGEWEVFKEDDQSEKDKINIGDLIENQRDGKRYIVIDKDYEYRRLIYLDESMNHRSISFDEAKRVNDSKSNDLSDHLLDMIVNLSLEYVKMKNYIYDLKRGLNSLSQISLDDQRDGNTLSLDNFSPFS